MTASFHDLLIEHLPQLRPYAMTLTRDRAKADDLVQETALKAWRAQAQFQTGTNIKAWLYCILRNEHISTLRRNKKQMVPLTDVFEEHLARKGEQEDHVLTRELLTAMDQLPAVQREVMMLNCVSGLSYDEIAATLNCSMGTVKSRLWRARAHMQRYLLDPTEAKQAKIESHREDRISAGSDTAEHAAH